MVSFASPRESFGARLMRHWRALFHLAWPVVFSRAGLVLMAVADVVMVGRYDTGALAALSLGYAVVMPALVTGIGCMVGIIATTARERGAGSTETTAVAVAHDGEWTRRRVGSPAVIRKVAGDLALPVYDVQLTGYPARMRAYNERRRQSESGEFA